MAFVHADLDIPVSIRNEILPSPSLSILQWIQFQFPVTMVKESTSQPSAFFSKSLPNEEDPLILRRLPIPHAQTVHRLLSVYKKHLEAGSKSLNMAHLQASTTRTRHLPLWMLTYWSEVISLRSKRKPWMSAEADLNKKRKIWTKSKDDSPVGQLVDEVYAALDAIQWSGSIRGFNNPEPLVLLSRYLSTSSWFSDVEQNQMLDLLRRDLLFDSEGKKTELQGLDFFQKLSEGFRAKETYIEGRAFARARGIGHGLATGSRNAIGMMINLDNEHWVSLVCNFQNETILYGDSLKRPMPDGVKEVIDWWTFNHAGKEFTHLDLDVPRQTDFHSCGLMAFYSLAVFLLPDTYHMIDPKDVDSERLKMLLRVINRHQDYVSNR